jgi:hypothetical protein
MQENPFTALGQAISQLLSSHSATLQATGLDMFRGVAVILIVWFGIKSALSASQGHGGFHFAKFADLILMIAFGLGMLTYYCGLLFANLLGLTVWIERKFFLRDTGRKLRHLDQEIHTGQSELSEEILSRFGGEEEEQ